MSEDELTQSLRASNVVLIPYSRYYQSGIAIRALEEGTPVVGRRHTFLESLLGAAYPGLVDSESTDEWLAAIERVVSRAHSVDLRGRAIRSEWEVVTGRRT
ncbi:hypothetical protein [Patulibacter sp. SYSU D01012]|uniref:hypothetical protein n=1 Tax=Patulibacter sp. SYSU D01012 TaxID=2817381 RepID=UPI001B30CD49|nr:hypothetical protein [Patulibacter sp. SYSU D01012]